MGHLAATFAGGGGRRDGVFRKVLDLFEPRERWKLGAIVLVMTATGLVQTAGFASIMPFVGLVANPELMEENLLLASLRAATGIEDRHTFLILTGMLVLVLIALANGLAALTSWLSLRLVWSYHHKLSLRLFEKYLSKPYSYFLGHHSARLSRTLLAEVKEVIKGVLVPGMEVLARLITAFFVVILLIVVDPVVAVTVALVVCGAYSIVYLTVRKRQREIGIRKVEAQTTCFRVSGEAFGGIKDVKVLGRERQFLSRFRAASRELARVNTSNSVVGQIPSHVLDTVAFGGIMVFLLYLLQTRETLDEVLPILALYAFAGNRLMPALHQIFSGVTKIRFNLAALDALHADLHEDELHMVPRARPAGPVPVVANPELPISFQKEVRFRSVSFMYPAAGRTALHNIDLVIPARKRVGIVGSTGSGKTTFVDLLLGLLAPTEGEILVDGTRLDDRTLSAWRAKIGYVPQGVFLCDDTIASNIAFGLPEDEIDYTAVQRAARAANLESFVAALPEGYATRVGERGVQISGGERQRISIARALYHNPDVLLLDEATSALDTVTEECVMAALEGLSADRTIVMIAHRLSTVRDCDIIYLFDKGTLADSGTYDHLVEASPIFRTMAGVA